MESSEPGSSLLWTGSEEEKMIMMKHKLRTVVVGLGRIAWGFHLPQICGHDGFELCAVVDPCRERLEEARRKFGVTRLYEDFSTMLEEVRPELTVIASPTIFHATQAVEAMRSGSDIFCDKPVALSFGETDTMFAAAERFGRRMMVYQPHRLTPEAVGARRIVDSGKLGKIYLMERHISYYARRNDWQAFRRNGGGMLLNYGAHYLDQMLDLLDYKVRRARCELRRIASLGDADDVVHALVTTGKGVLIDLDINQAVALPLPEWRICGEWGTALYEGGKWHMRYFDPAALPERKADRTLAAAGRRYPSEPIPWKDEEISDGAADPDAYYRLCYDYFAAGGAPFVPAAQTLELMHALDLCRADAEIAEREVVPV